MDENGKRYDFQVRVPTDYRYDVVYEVGSLERYGAMLVRALGKSAVVVLTDNRVNMRQNQSTLSSGRRPWGQMDRPILLSGASAAEWAMSGTGDEGIVAPPCSCGALGDPGARRCPLPNRVIPVYNTRAFAWAISQKRLSPAATSPGQGNQTSQAGISCLDA